MFISISGVIRKDGEAAMFLECFQMFYIFFKLGFLSFGGGYAMLSMIIAESRHFSVSPAQFADLNVLDMVVPGSISINAATYVGYLHEGFTGAVVATLGVSLPSFILTVVVMRCFKRFGDNTLLKDALSGIKPAAVGMIAAAAMTISDEVLTVPGKNINSFVTDPTGTLSLFCLIIFIFTAVLNIRFKVSPILLTVFSGIAGALLAS